MRKRITIALLLSCICLAGCSNEEVTTGNEEADRESEESAKPDNTEETPQDEQQSDTEEDSVLISDSPSTPEQNDFKEGSMSQEKVIASVKEQIRNSMDPKLPEQLPLSSNELQLSAETHLESDTYRVTFFESKKAIPVNSNQLNDSNIAKPIAVIEAHQYDSEKEAKSQIGYISPEDIQTGGEPIDLGYSIKGYGEAGAGNKWLNWHEGRWYLQVHASNIDGNSDYVPLAKRMVAYLEENMLPAPNEVGTIKADVDPEKVENNRVSWQEGTTVYTISNVEDPMNMVEIACNFSNMENE